MSRAVMFVRYRQYSSIVVRPCGKTILENVVLKHMAYEPMICTPSGTV